MTAVASIFFLLFVFFSGCQNSCNRPAPPAPPSPSAAASPAPTTVPTATPLPTPIPFAQRNFPALSSNIVGKAFDYTPDDAQEVHLISAKMGEDSKLIAKANHVSRFA